jgi:hypothetical protein
MKCEAKKMKPILFSTPMVRAVLNTKPGAWPAEPADPEKPFKWQTRRIIHPRYRDGEAGFIVVWGLRGTFVNIIGEDGQFTRNEQPPYLPGDILWVRETFAKTSEGEYLYRADPVFDHCGKGDIGWDWKPSIHMPREAARLFLEVKDARVEKLQDIIKAEGDAKAEGVTTRHQCGGNPEKRLDICVESKRSCYVCVFKDLWNELNAKRGYSWLDNPYVYVYEFTRLDPEEAQRRRRQNA